MTVLLAALLLNWLLGQANAFLPRAGFAGVPAVGKNFGSTPKSIAIKLGLFPTGAMPEPDNLPIFDANPPAIVRTVDIARGTSTSLPSIPILISEAESSVTAFPAIADADLDISKSFYINAVIQNPEQIKGTTDLTGKDREEVGRVVGKRVSSEVQNILSECGITTKVSEDLIVGDYIGLKVEVTKVELPESAKSFLHKLLGTEQDEKIFLKKAATQIITSEIEGSLPDKFKTDNIILKIAVTSQSTPSIMANNLLRYAYSQGGKEGVAKLLMEAGTR